MTEVYIEITGAVASASKNGPLVAGMVGVPANFSFDDSWGGLNITVVFSGSGKKIDWPLLDERTLAIPWEVMTKPNTQLQIGAEGRLPNGTLVIPTVWATVGTLKAGAQSTGNLAQPPSPTPYDRIMSAIGDLNQLNTEAKDSLVAAINEAAQSGGGEIDAEEIQRIVAEYLAANPLQENDPNVSEWAKQPEKPTYTAEEVGALPADTQIPTELPNPAALTLTGAVSATYDGSKAVEVEIPSGGGDAWDYEKTIVLSEAVGSVLVDTFDDGEPLALSSVEIISVTTNNTASTVDIDVKSDLIVSNSSSDIRFTTSGGYTSAGKWVYCWLKGSIIDGDCVAEFANSVNVTRYVNYYSGVNGTNMKAIQAITYSTNTNEILPSKATKFIAIKINVPTGALEANSVIRIRGVRA